MTLREALNEYKNVYMAYRNFAKRTRVEYQNDLESFIEYLEKASVYHVKDVGLPVIERYVANLEVKGFASLTRKKKVVTIRSFLMFLHQDGLIDTNLAKRIVLPFAESATPNILTEAECNRLKEACTGNPRDRAIIEMLLETGIKLSELTRLTPDDLEIERAGEKDSGYIRIIGGRGKKDRLIPINFQVFIALKDYLRVRNRSTNEPLFLNRFGKPLGNRGVQKIIGKYFKSVGINAASVHTIRHTFGARQVAEGLGLKKAQEILGLKDIRSALAYQRFTSGG